jgi:hypothetical protein
MKDRQTTSSPRSLKSILTFSDEQERNIEILCEVAKQSGTSLSLKEALELTSLGLTAEEFEIAWKHSKALGSKYKIYSGRIIENADSIDGGEMEKRQTRAEWNLQMARKFVSLFRTDEDLKLLSVSGSTSYHSVSEQDDLDFFCVTKKGSLWIFLAKAFIFGRLFRMRETGSPPLCFSYVMEEDYARRLFRESSDGLFARDAITAIILKGQNLYSELLKENKFIGLYFPKMYLARLSELLEKDHHSQDQERSHSKIQAKLRTIMNSFLRYSLGNYIHFKSYFLNRKFTKDVVSERRFKAKIGKEFCLYESNDYSELRKKYASLQILPH